MYSCENRFQVDRDTERGGFAVTLAGLEQPAHQSSPLHGRLASPQWAFTPPSSSPTLRRQPFPGGQAASPAASARTALFPPAACAGRLTQAHSSPPGGAMERACSGTPFSHDPLH